MCECVQTSSAREWRARRPWQGAWAASNGPWSLRSSLTDAQEAELLVQIDRLQVGARAQCCVLLRLQQENLALVQLNQERASRMEVG